MCNNWKNATAQNSDILSILGISLSVLAVALNVGWILLNLREVALLALGDLFRLDHHGSDPEYDLSCSRDPAKCEQHDAFLNSVTHELKTPIASIRLYLDTLRQRDVDPETRAEFLRKNGSGQRQAAAYDRTSARGQPHS